MQLNHKGYCIELTATRTEHMYAGQAVIRPSATRHTRKRINVRYSGAIGKFKTPDEAVKSALDWAFSNIDGPAMA